MSELDASRHGLSIEAARGGPPAEVLDQIASAGRIHEQLHRAGEELAFVAGAPGEPVRIEVRDRQGNTLRTLSVAEAMEIAAGKPVD